MKHSGKLFLAVSAMALCFSLPLRSGPIGPQVILCKGIANDFGTPLGEFGNCWSPIGDVTAGAAGVGPTIAQGTGLDTSAANLQTFIGNGSSFLFSSFTAETIGTGSAIRNSLTLTGSGSLNVAFTTQTPTGSIGFLVVENLGNSSFSFITLFDIPVAVANLSPIQLGAGSYELTIGIAGASGIVAVNAGIGAAATGPAITGVTIQDTSAPEPAAAWLLAAGLGAVALLRRRIMHSAK